MSRYIVEIKSRVLDSGDQIVFFLDFLYKSKLLSSMALKQFHNIQHPQSLSLLVVVFAQITLGFVASSIHANLPPFGFVLVSTSYYRANYVN